MERTGIEGLKVALVHERLNVWTGSDKVLWRMSQLYPDAPIFTALADPKLIKTYLSDAKVNTSFLQKHKIVSKYHQKFLPLFMLAFEQFDLSEFDVVVSSSHCAAKGIITRPSTCHICYCHSPMRYAWDMSHEYARFQGKVVRSAWALLSNYIRMWDLGTAQRVDYFIANSKHVARRIKKYYGKPAEVIYPPVDVDRFAVSPTVDDYYVVVTRFAPYKRVDLVIEAFNRLGWRLLVIGEGEQEAYLKQMAKPNVEFLGYVPDDRVAEHLSRCRGSIIAAEEDFGITTVESIAAGRPVVAYGVGGSTEIITPGVNGVFFKEPTAESLVEALKECDSTQWDPYAIRDSSLRFSTAVFQQELAAFVARAVEQFREE